MQSAPRDGFSTTTGGSESRHRPTIDTAPYCGEVERKHPQEADPHPPGEGGRSIAAVKIALCQTNCGDDVAANEEQVFGLLERAAADGVDLAALPEVWPRQGSAREIREAAEPVPGPRTDRLAKLAARHRMWVHGGSVLERDGERIFNTSVLFDRSGERSLVDHYQAAYRADAPGFRLMVQRLQELAAYAQARKIRLYLAVAPDVHNLLDYPFTFVHDTMRQIAEREGYTYIDLLPALRGRRPEELFAMPGDPHPNALGHALMADAILPVVAADDLADGDRR